MTSKRAYYLMLGMLAFGCIGLVSLLYFGNQLLAKESGKLVDLKAQNQVLETQQTDLLKAQGDIKRYSNLEDITQAIVPQDKDQARAVREVIQLANESGVSIKNVTFPSSNLGTKTSPQSGQGQESSNSGQAAPNPVISQAKPVQNMKGLYRIEMSLVSAEKQNYYRFINFLSKLEKNRRTAQIARVKVEPEPPLGASSDIKFTVGVNIYLKP